MYREGWKSYLILEEKTKSESTTYVTMVYCALFMPQDDGGDGPLSLSVCAWGFREHEFVSVPRFSSGRRHVWWKDVAVTLAPE